MGTAKKIALITLGLVGGTGAYIWWKIRQGTVVNPNNPPVLSILSAQYPSTAARGDIISGQISIKNTGGPDDVEYGFMEVGTGTTRGVDTTFMASGSTLTTTVAAGFLTAGTYVVQAFARAKSFAGNEALGPVFTIVVV